MDKLEQYLDQVCRRVGGLRSLRQHIRQELREHLRDAVAEHRAAGMSEEEALARALEDFGGPEEVRSELEEAHGHRLMAVVIDKAMQWKEKTMKARWLWTTWAHFVLIGVIATEMFFITFAAIYLMPRIKMFIREGWIAIDDFGAALAWVPPFFVFQDWLANNTAWLLLGAVVLWGLFEWRVRSENKSLMRLAAFGTTALVLMAFVTLTGAALVLPVAAGLPAMNARDPEPVVRRQLASVDTSIAELEAAVAKKDWDASWVHANRASTALFRIKRTGASVPALAAMHEQSKVDDARAQLDIAIKAVMEAEQAIRDKDPVQSESAMKKFHEAYGQLQGAAKPAK
jgi:hypothetical protein